MVDGRQALGPWHTGTCGDLSIFTTRSVTCDRFNTASIVNTMANTCTVNRRAEKYFASKRQRLNAGGSYHNRLPILDDFLDVHSCDAHLTLARKIPIETPRTAQRGQTTWLEGREWEPEDNRELGLVDTADWADDAYDLPAIQLPISPSAKAKQKGKRLPVSNMPASCLSGILTNSQKRRPHLIWKARYR